MNMLLVFLCNSQQVREQGCFPRCIKDRILVCVFYFRCSCHGRGMLLEITCSRLAEDSMQVEERVKDIEAHLGQRPTFVI